MSGQGVRAKTKKKVQKHDILGSSHWWTLFDGERCGCNGNCCCGNNGCNGRRYVDGDSGYKIAVGSVAAGALMSSGAKRRAAEAEARSARAEVAVRELQAQVAHLQEAALDEAIDVEGIEEPKPLVFPADRPAKMKLAMLKSELQELLAAAKSRSGANDLVGADHFREI